MRPVLALFVCTLACIALAQQGADFIVIADDDYADAIQPLVEWRHASGIRTKLALTSQIGSDSASVRNYIRNAWLNWPVKPAFVLLIASPSEIRAIRYGNRWRYYSDNYYADLEGDVKAEVAVGRFPCRSASEAELMVAKTLYYEREPYVEDSTWMLRLTTVVREGGDSDDTIYWNNSRNLARLAGEHGFISCDSLSGYRGHHSGHVISSIDSGTAFVLYRGTAGGWWRDPFNVNPYNTSNGRKLPIVFSMTCETMSLDPYDVLLGQYFMFAGTVENPAGCVAFYGNTVSGMSVARQRGAAARGIASGLFEDELHRMGLVVLRSKLQLITEFPYDDEDYRGLSLFGDPCLPVWYGRPQVLAVDHPLEILVESLDVTVTVTHNGEAVENAVVCASMDTVVYSVDTTDAYGEATLPVAPADTGFIRLVVTGRNLVPYDGGIHVVTQVAVRERFPAMPTRARMVARPSVVSRACTFVWDSPGAAVLEIRDPLGRTLRSIDVSGKRSVTWESSGSMPAGVYYCRLADAADRTLGTCRVLRAD